MKLLKRQEFKKNCLFLTSFLIPYRNMELVQGGMIGSVGNKVYN